MQGGQDSERGIIPRVAEIVMGAIESKQRGDPLKAKTQYSVNLSYLEIYNEKVIISNPRMFEQYSQLRAGV